MKMCFKLHQNHTINEEFDYWAVKEAGGGGEVPRFQKFEKLPTDRWYQATPKISALLLN